MSMTAKSLRLLPLTLGLWCAGASIAAAVPIFSDNFDAYLDAGDTELNWNPSGTPWIVTNGTVDLVQNTDYGITCRGASAACVDLDGTSQNAGILSTVASGLFNLTAGTTYELSAWLSGSQRTFDPPTNPLNDPNEIEFGFKTAGNVTVATNHVGPLAISDAFALYTLTYTPSADVSLKIFFSSLSGSDDDIGAILDDVSLSAVPVPAALPLLLSGLGALGALIRRRRRIA